MCQWCYCANSRIEIGPIQSKYSPNRPVNPTIVCEAGQRVMDSVIRAVTDPFEQRAVFTQVMAGIQGSGAVTNHPRRPLISGVSDDFLEFHEALSFLQKHNPTRMKAIEQLESNYQKSVHAVKQQRKSALASLQTRQSLEMDMLTNSKGYAKSDMQSLVNQHLPEMEALLAHWATEVKALQDMQLREYKELVMEVYQSELGAGDNKDCTTRNARTYARPEIVGLQWECMRPIAVVRNPDHRARLVRFTRLRGDYLSAVIAPGSTDIDSILDPEEQCTVSRSDVVSAVLLGGDGSLAFRSNQDCEIINCFDSKCPTDCRWPAMADQLAQIRTTHPYGISDEPLFVTRHSNLAHGVGLIFHCFSSDAASVQAVLEWCDSLGIQRLFVPDILVPDLRSPSLTDREARAVAFQSTLIETAKKCLYNSVGNVSLDEIVLVSPCSCTCHCTPTTTTILVVDGD